MSKYRAREIVEAVQFKVGGPDIEGVYRLDNGVYLLDRFHFCKGEPFTSGDGMGGGGLLRAHERYSEITDGDYIVTATLVSDCYAPSFRYVLERDVFEKRYEDIGG